MLTVPPLAHAGDQMPVHDVGWRINGVDLFEAKAALRGLHEVLRLRQQTAGQKNHDTSDNKFLHGCLPGTQEPATILGSLFAGFKRRSVSYGACR